MTGQIKDGGRVTDAMVEQIIDRAAQENSADGMDGDSWDRLLVRAALASRCQSPASPAGVPDVRSDAEQWGNALNEASWAFIEACPEKSALLFNTSKASLRTAILKYLDLVAAAPSAPSEAQS